VRVAVVDNGSEPPASPPLDARVVLVRNDRNRGTSAGRNQGAACGTGELVCFLDSDASLEPSTLAQLAAPLLRDPSIVAAAPVFVDQRPEESAGAAPTFGVKVGRLLGWRSDYRASARDPDADLWDVDFAITACLLVRRAPFEEAGGFDESYFYAPEDVDLCLRLREAGWRIVQVPGARCHHPPRRRNRRLFTRRGLDHGWSVVRHLWRHRHFHRRVGRDS
jgi:hypothetical protein